MRPGEKRGPDFIGVGPGKTGTSWIHKQLRMHPQVVFPPLREFRYFWEHANFPKENLLQRFALGDSSYSHQYRDYFRHFLKRYSRNPARLLAQAKRLAWDCRYLFGHHDDEWYLSCFEPKAGFVCGEISPQYFFLDDEGIGHIQRLLPYARIIISLREPTDWFWSVFRMHNPEPSRQHDDVVFEDFLSAERPARSFSKALRRWRKGFSDDQLLIVFYDELRASPWQFYARICEFLAIVPDRARFSELGTRVNEGNGRRLPNQFRRRIEEAWREDTEELASMLPSLPASWGGAAARRDHGLAVD